MTKQKPHMKPPMHKEELQQRNYLALEWSLEKLHVGQWADGKEVGLKLVFLK